MVCPNCQSADIVELQNEHFCINCGRLIQLVTKKRGPGRPKADRLDKPKPLTIKLAGKAVAVALDQPRTVETDLVADISPEIEEPTETVASQTDITIKSQSTDVSTPKISHQFNVPSSEAESNNLPTAPEEAAKIAAIKVRKRLQDILPAKADDLTSEDPMSESPLHTPSRLSLSQIVSASWSEPWQDGPARILILSAVLSGLGTSASLSLAVFHIANLSSWAAIVGFFAIILGIALMFGVANTERAAFALRRYDHRPIPRSWLFGGALSVLARQTTVLVAGLIDAGLLLALGYYLGCELPKVMTQPYSTTALLSSYFVIAVVLLLVWVKTGLAAAGVELGRMSALGSLKFGWRSLGRHPELLGTRLVAALWLASSLTGVIALAYLIHLYIPNFDHWTIIGGGGAVAFTAVLLGNFGAVGWRQASYRELVIMDEPERAIAMLSGHHNGTPSKIATFSYVFVVVSLILGGIGAILSSFLH